MGLFSRGPDPDHERRRSFEHEYAPEPPPDTPSVQPGAESAPERTLEPETPPSPTLTEALASRPFAPIAESIPEPADDDELRISASEAIKPRRDLTPKPAEPGAEPATKRSKVI